MVPINLTPCVRLLFKSIPFYLKFIMHQLRAINAVSFTYVVYTATLSISMRILSTKVHTHWKWLCPFTRHIISINITNDNSSETIKYPYVFSVLVTYQAQNCLLPIVHQSTFFVNSVCRNILV